MDVQGGEGKAFRGFARGSVPAVRKGKFFCGREPGQAGQRACRSRRGKCIDRVVFSARSRACSGQRKRAPEMSGTLFYLVSGLRFAATVTGAAAAEKSPEPTHVRSPVGTAHDEQLTEHIP
jgi:hypothetical protein